MNQKTRATQSKRVQAITLVLVLLMGIGIVILNFTALVDKEETTKTAYQTTGVPETFIIDRNGNIVEKVIGPRDWASSDAIDYFRNLLQQK